MAKDLPCTDDVPGSMPKEDRQQMMHIDRKQKHRGNGTEAAGSHPQVAIVTRTVCSELTIVTLNSSVSLEFGSGCGRVGRVCSLRLGGKSQLDFDT